MLLDTGVYAMLVTASHLVQKGIAGEKICLFIIPVIIAAIFLLNYLTMITWLLRASIMANSLHKFWLTIYRYPHQQKSAGR